MSTATVTATRTVTAAPPTVSVSPNSGAAALRGMKFGDEYTIPSKQTTATVLGFDNDSPGSQGSAHRYVALEIKVCVKTATTVGYDAWTLIGTDDSTNTDIISGGGLKEPQYQEGNPLAAGECARGWITYELPKDEKIKQAKYAPTNARGNSVGIALWRV